MITLQQYTKQQQQRTENGIVQDDCKTIAFCLTIVIKGDSF